STVRRLFFPAEVETPRRQLAGDGFKSEELVEHVDKRSISESREVIGSELEWMSGGDPRRWPASTSRGLLASRGVLPNTRTLSDGLLSRLRLLAGHRRSGREAEMNVDLIRNLQLGPWSVEGTTRATGLIFGSPSV